ncbi:hypothetical protein BDZ94DRAFT_1245119 [Collybia nuda]|uniref:Uncharacterized protein n=1 Tax=Collybia nuda TaxID=64659 RepID=A0A9P5YGS4_9AGAR|nr:hypothetical protein BDZ94DRAFT_1245119 [Collybia nuda]
MRKGDGRGSEERRRRTGWCRGHLARRIHILTCRLPLTCSSVVVFFPPVLRLRISAVLPIVVAVLTPTRSSSTFPPTVPIVSISAVPDVSPSIIRCPPRLQNVCSSRY